MSERIFYLPDLGEGLPDAQIHEWFVSPGNFVKEDEPLVAMETAKAIVDVPAPFSGKVSALHGKPGDIIETGSALVSFSDSKQESHTIAGRLLEGSHIWHEIPTSEETVLPNLQENTTSEPLQGFRQSMFINMSRAHREVMPVSIIDDVDISHWEEKTDITVRLLKAMASACTHEPALNAHFNTRTQTRILFNTVHVGLAVDTKEGSFLPVIKDVQSQTSEQLRASVNTCKTSLSHRRITSEKKHEHTIILSNFGTIAGKYATPAIMPPAVATLGVGRIYAMPVLIEGALFNRKLLPLSLTIDHRVVTGGEAARFLSQLVNSLAK